MAVTPRVFVVGAGLAGLAAATMLAARGHAVTLFEAAAQAGGRCRSYFDPSFGAVIDNGNHLVLSGNQAVYDYLGRIGATGHLSGPRDSRFDFADIQSGERWTIHPNDGPVPWWVTSKTRRVPGTSAGDYAAYGKLMLAGPHQTIGDILPGRGALWDRLMHPFLLAALNTEPKQASARLAGAILRQTLLKGGGACRPRIATPTLAEAFIDPALHYLQSKGGMVQLGKRLRALVMNEGTVLALEFADATVPLSATDQIVLAVPPWAAKELLPGLSVPHEFRAIVNGHFKLPAPAGAPQILGVIGGMAEWIFTFPDRISVTVSAADAIIDRDREDLARTLWADVCTALGISAPLPGPSSLPRWQIVKEKRATFAATPGQDQRRPPARSLWRNLILAGDWTQTGLPATIEGALQSGHRAAALAMAQQSL